MYVIPFQVTYEVTEPFSQSSGKPNIFNDCYYIKPSISVIIGTCLKS